MGRRRGFDYGFFVMVAFLGLLVMIVYLYPGLGLPAGATGTLLSLAPGLIIVLAGFYGWGKAQGAARFGALIGVGLGLCVLLNGLDAEGMLTAQILHGLTIGQFQMGVLVASIVVGAWSASK